jgi:hypothetical protein
MRRAHAQEIVRYGGSELHNISATGGGEDHHAPVCSVGQHLRLQRSLVSRHLRTVSGTTIVYGSKGTCDV